MKTDRPFHALRTAGRAGLRLIAGVVVWAGCLGSAIGQNPPPLPVKPGASPPPIPAAPAAKPAAPAAKPAAEAKDPAALEEPGTWFIAELKDQTKPEWFGTGHLVIEDKEDASTYLWEYELSAPHKSVAFRSYRVEYTTRADGSFRSAKISGVRGDESQANASFMTDRSRNLLSMTLEGAPPGENPYEIAWDAKQKTFAEWLLPLFHKKTPLSPNMAATMEVLVPADIVSETRKLQIDAEIKRKFPDAMKGEVEITGCTVTITVPAGKAEPQTLFVDKDWNIFEWAMGGGAVVFRKVNSKAEAYAGRKPIPDRMGRRDPFKVMLTKLVKGPDGPGRDGVSPAEAMAALKELQTLYDVAKKTADQPASPQRTAQLTKDKLKLQEKFDKWGSKLSASKDKQVQQKLAELRKKFDDLPSPQDDTGLGMLTRIKAIRERAEALFGTEDYKTLLDPAKSPAKDLSTLLAKPDAQVANVQAAGREATAVIADLQRRATIRLSFLAKAPIVTGIVYSLQPRMVDVDWGMTTLGRTVSVSLPMSVDVSMSMAFVKLSPTAVGEIAYREAIPDTVIQEWKNALKNPRTDFERDRLQDLLNWEKRPCQLFDPATNTYQDTKIVRITRDMVYFNFQDEIIPRPLGRK